VGLLAEGVDYYHYRVVSVRFREFNEVDAYGVPADVRRRKRLKVTGWRLSQDLGAEAEIAGSSVLTDVPRHVWPPVIPCDQFECFPSTRMPGDVTVMMESPYLPSDVSSRGNIDFTTEVQHSVCFRPLGRADRAGRSGLQCFDCLFHSILQFLTFCLPSDEPE
jgi:hypothetical protein